jgi:cell division cycle protein 20 (cofactor of APC complex)
MFHFSKRCYLTFSSFNVSFAQFFRLLIMTRSVVDYEYLINTSFSDTNKSNRSSVRPRWERKRQQGTGKRPPLSSYNCGDRFIPNRAGMNMELSKHMLRGSPEEEDTPVYEDVEMSNAQNQVPSSQKVVPDANKQEYNSRLSAALLGVDDKANNRIMSFQEKAPTPKGDTVNNLNILYSASASASQKKTNTKLVNRAISSAPSRVLDAPDLMDDYYLNLLSWSDTNILAVALSNTVYLWNAGTGDIQELCTYEDGPNAHISSVAWVQEGGAHLAVGTSGGKTQLWDVDARKQIRGMDGHSDRVGSMAWNRHILTTGSRDTNIVNHDVRVARHNIATLSGHSQEVCGLSWSNDGEVLASGGNDNLLCLWDASSSGINVDPRFQLTDHQAAVKALAWSPHERHLLATGGGTADRCIKFWSSQTGALLNSIDTGSQVCALQWNPFEKEILSSHGFARNQLCLWKYPTMAKIKELEGHTSRVLHMCCSPDGGTVVSAAGDETLRFWEVFAAPSKSKHHSSTEIYGGSSSMPSKLSWTSQIR